MNPFLSRGPEPTLQRKVPIKTQYDPVPHSCALKVNLKTSSRLVDTWIRVNDPSAGSPTER